MILKKEFFDRKADKVARDLVGKYLVRKIKGKEKAYKILETEAYLGEEDEASHARFGKTKRSEIMFGPSGIIYIYMIYGMYFMLNIVTDKNESASAVLIRAAIMSTPSVDIMASDDILDGPGKLTRALKIDMGLNGKGLSKKTGLWFEDRGEKAQTKKMPRIGINYAGKKWREAPLRFVLK